MMYQRLSGALVSVVLLRSVIIGFLGRRRRADEVEHPEEAPIEHGDVQPDHDADREDQHGQVADLLTGRPADFLQLGPDLIEIAADSLQVVLLSGSLVGCGRGDRTRTYN